MNFLVKKFIDYLIFFGLIFIINSCAHFRIINLEKNNYNSQDFYKLLSKEYLDLAKYELYEMHDEIDANLFAYKSSLSLNKNIFYPENPVNWKIPNNYKDKAILLYNKVNKLIDEKIYINYPENFSKVLAAYDCWIEQVEENWQTEHIALCYERFNSNYDFITKKISALKKELEKQNTSNIDNKEKENEKSSLIELSKDNKSSKIDTNLSNKSQVFEIKVFFDFDKFTLSSEQIIELEFFIKTAMQHSDMDILIEGHTDTMGTISYNNILSEKRAKFIEKYLMQRNLVNTIKTKFYGENKPLISTNDEVKEEKNRRAELYLK